MRIAVIADIHGNLRALEEVRRDLARCAPDVVVNLGDHVSGPLQAAAAADLLMAENYVHIRGNHDRQLLDRSPEQMGPSDRAAYGQLHSRHLAWLASLPPTDRLADGVLLCHGSPANDLEYLLEEIEADRVRLAHSELIRERLRGEEAKLILCGHSHVPRVVLLGDGTWIVNPGSVGLPAFEDTNPVVHYVEVGSPHARYAIIDWNGSAPQVEFIALEYEWESASEEATFAERPDWAHALLTGYALRPE